MKHISISFLILLGISSCNAQSSYAPKTKTDTSQGDTSVPKVAKYIAEEQNEPAQNVPASTSGLEGTKWKEVSPIEDDEETTWEFSQKQIIINSYYSSEDEKYEFVLPYYISNSRPVEFEEKLVGNYRAGYYIVVQEGDTRKRMDYYTIMTCDLKTGDMYLFRERKEDEIGGRDVTIHLKLLSKSAGSTGSHGEGKR